MAVCEEKFWFCDQCGKCFHDRLSQTLHRRTHSIYRPYRCTHKLCTQAFSELSQLQRHKRVHNNHRKYRCRICKTKFLYLHHLKLHRCRIKDTKIYTCCVCSSKFLQILSLAHHMKTKHSNQKWKRKVKKIKLKSDRQSKGKDKMTPESGKEKILLKIALGKSMTVISPSQTPSHINKLRHAKKKSNKKDKIHRKRLQKNGIILSFRNGSVSSVPLSIENMKEETPVRKLKPFKINGLLNKVVDEPKIPKLRIKTCAYTAVRRDESTEDEDVPELYSMKENSILTCLKKEETKMETCDGLTNISYVPENPSSKVSTKPRSGIIIHKDKSGKYSSAGQLQTSKSSKCETINSARCAGLWEVMPSPRTDSPSDFLKLRFSPMKPLKLDSGLDNTFECANAKYLDVSFKTKAVDSCAEDSDVFETSPSAAGANSVNDSGIEVLSSSSCNRSNGNSVRSVIMDENSPTYFLAEDSLISLDSPLVEAVSKAEHSICMKCGGIIIETNNNTRSPSKCQCSFISPYFTSPNKNVSMVSDDGYTEMEADISVKEQPLHVQDETPTSDIHVPAFVKNYNKINTDFSPNSICNFTPVDMVEVTKVETNESSPLKMKFRLEREPCANIQKQETVVCAVTENKNTEETKTIQKRKPLFRSDSKTGTIKDLDTGKKKTAGPAETSISSAIERGVSTKKPLFKPLKKEEPEDIKVNDIEIEMECESNDEASESHIQTSEAVIIVDESSDDSQSLNTNCNRLSERLHGSNERTMSKNKVAEQFEKDSSFEIKQKIEKSPKKKRASKSPIVNTIDETSLSPNDKARYHQEERCMHENKPSTVDEIEEECESNYETSESHIQTSEAVIIVDETTESTDDSQSLNTNCNRLSERLHGSNERTRSKNTVAEQFEKVSSFEIKQKIEESPKKNRPSKSPIVNTIDETSLSPNDKDRYHQEERCMHENKPSTVDEIEEECESNYEASESHIQTSAAVIIVDETTESSDDSQSLNTNCNRLSERLHGSNERTRSKNTVAEQFEKVSSFEIKQKIEESPKKKRASKSPIVNTIDETSLSPNDKDRYHQEERCMHENKPSTVDEIEEECESNYEASESHIQTSAAVIIVDETTESSDDSQSLNTNCNRLSERLHGSNERTRSKNTVAEQFEKVSSFEIKQKIEESPKKKRASKSPIVNTIDETISPNDKDRYHQEERCMHENKPSTVDEIEEECESNYEASESHIQTSAVVIIVDETTESSDDSQSLNTNCNRLSERLHGSNERTRSKNKVAEQFEIKQKIENSPNKKRASKSLIVNTNDETSVSPNDKDRYHQDERCMHENKPSTVDEIEEECESNYEASESHIQTSEAVIIVDKTTERSDDSQSLNTNCNRMSESRLLGTNERTRNENKVAGKFENISSFEIKHKLEKSPKKRKASKSPIINTNDGTSLSPNDKVMCHQEESCMHENKPSTVDGIAVIAKATDADDTIDLSPVKSTSDVNLSVPPVSEIVSFNTHTSPDISSQSQLDFATKSPVNSPSKSTMPSPVISQLDHISVSPSKSSSRSLSVSPSKYPSVSPSKAASKLSADIPGKNRENIFSTMASDFHHSSSVSPEKSSTSGFHNKNKTDTPLKSGNDDELCKSPNEQMLVCFGQEMDDLNCKEVDNDHFAMKRHVNNPAKIENEVNVLEEAKSHSSATPSIDKDISQPANSGLSSVVKHTSIIASSCAADFNEGSLQSLQQLPKETDLSIIAGVCDESEDSLQQLPNVVGNLPTTSSTTPETREKKNVTSPLDLFQLQFLSFLSNKGTGLEQADNKNIGAVTDTTEKENTIKNKNKRVKPCGKRKAVLKKSNHSNKIKPSDKSEKSDVDMDVTASKDIGESCGVGIVNDPLFDTEMDLEHSPENQNNDKSSTALDWLKCTFDSNTNEDSGNISKGSQSPELDLTIIVKDTDMKGKNSTDLERTKSGGSKLKLKKQSTRSKFDQLEVKSNFPTAKKKLKVSRVDDTHQKQILEYESENSVNSFTSDSNSNHNHEKTNLINSQKAKGDRRPVGVKRSRSETKMIEIDSDNSHSLSSVQTFKSLSTQNIDGASHSSNCANVKGYNNTGTNQYFGDSDPDYNPFGEPDDDFDFRHRIGSHRPKRRCITDDSSDDFPDEETNLRSENRTCEKIGDSDDSRNRGRRTMQGRKSCCPCCLGLSRSNKQGHDGYAHTKHMYNLPRNYKQFIKSTTKLLALQERVHKLFISLFPDCSNLISKSQVGTEDFELLIDEVISGLGTNKIEFESVNSGILLNNISTVEPFYTETASTCPILPSVLLGTDCNTEDSQQPTNEDMQTEVTKTMQYLVDAVIMKSDPVECHCISNSEGTPCTNCCQHMETFNQSMSEPNVPEIHEDGTIVKQKHAYNTEVITNSLNYDTNNECSNHEVLPVDRQLDNCNYGDTEMPTLLNIRNNETDSLTLPRTMEEYIQVDQSNAFLPLLNASIVGENSTFDNEAVPLQFGIESEGFSSMSSAISPVENKLVITIDLNAARVSLCKHPSDCLQRLHAKIVQLVTALLPNLKLKRSILKNQDNLEFLLDLIAKSNDGPITSDHEEVEPFDEKSPTVAAFVANCSAIVTADSEPVCVEVIRTDRKMNDETSNNGERHEKCGNVITNFLAKCEKLEAEKNECCDNNEKASSETLNMLKEERMPLFSKCQEMFENDIKSRKESLKKDIFEFEQDPDAVLTDPKGAEHVIRSFKKLTRKKRVDIAKKYRKIAKREDKRRKANRVPATSSGSLLDVGNESLQPDSDSTDNTKKRFLSELSLGDKNMNSTTAGGGDQVENTGNSTCSSRQQLTVKSSESSELPSPDSKRHADKNIFELMRPHMEPSSSL